MELTQSMKDKTIYSKTTTELARKFYKISPIQPEWYDELEIILQDLAYGYIDSIECVHKLSLLGYSIEEIERDIMGDVKQK
jgi:hypothetical protein